MTEPPIMHRSRGQIANAYAPHSLFTFEGGSGACMAVSASNRTADLSNITAMMIGEQIDEYFVAWFARAGRGANLLHPVPANLAVDQRVLTDGLVRVRTGEFAFQIPDEVGYVPFPLAFTCSRCGLHRECRNLKRLEEDAARFRSACPSGAANCADDWQQIDVVLAHWSGEVEGISPSYRHWVTDRQEIRDLSRCSSCESDRFYLRKPPGPLAGWHFECASCRLVRPMLQRDLTTLTALGALTDQNLATFSEINMEPVSYRASAAYYPHGDRLLVFEEDRFLTLLGNSQASELEALLTTIFGYPASSLSEADKERLLRAAGRGNDWTNHQNMIELLRLVEGNPGFTPDMVAAQRNAIAEREAEWNRSVFAGHQQASAGISQGVRERDGYVRRFDPIRMAVEHVTLAQEKLRGGQMRDGKEVSVDVMILDNFLRPDGLSAEDRTRMSRETRHRLNLLGIEEMRLLRDVRICEYTFAYTRTSSSPVVRRDKAGDAELPVRLRLFDRVEVGDSSKHPVLCLVQSNEGLYVKLNEATVREWLAANGANPVPTSYGARLGGALIEEFAAIENDAMLRFSRFLDEYRRERAVPRRAYPMTYTLLHTIAHHLIATCAMMSGLDLGSFGEHLFVPDLAFLVYRRGMTMDLGNLSSMWRDRGDPALGNEVLERMVNPVSMRCGSESICNHRGGACPDCILIPENACITRNELLSRSSLIGRGAPRWDETGQPLIGFLDIARSRITSRAIDA